MLRLLLIILLVGARAAAEDRLNVVFLIADDYCTALQSYGRDHCQTPNLDQLAREGMRFTDAFCQFGVCGPSRASIMCGMYPPATGVVANGQHFRKTLPDHVTMSQRFRQAGYRTMRVSKIYHMGVPGDILLGTPGDDDPESWDETYNMLAPEHLTPGEVEDLSHGVGGDVVGPGLDAARDDWYAGRRRKVVTRSQGSDFISVRIDDGDSQPDAMAATQAIELLESVGDEPFFLAVGFVRPHVPLVAPRELFDQLEAFPIDLPRQQEDDLEDLPQAARLHTNDHRYKMSDDQARRAILAYFASVWFMDIQVGRILDALERLNLRDNTIVVFTSDHGYHLGEHTMWQKQSAFEQGARVPLIISAPGKPRWKTCSRIVELVDIYPTLTELCGLSTPDAVQGSSLVPLLNRNTDRRSKNDAFIMTGNASAVRTERWKYIQYRNRRGQIAGTAMFDLMSDPGEFTNLAGRPEQRDQEQRLRQRLHELIDQASRPGPR